MKINSNIQALITQNVLRTNEEKHSSSTERLSSGFKINHAKDSPAGMAISNKMNAQIKSLYKAKDNASNAVNVIQTADGALTEVHNMLQRMNELGIKASTGTLTSSDRDAIQREVDQLRKEIDRIAADTEYNTQNLLGGEQSMRGYTDNQYVKVVDYDVDFPKGDYKLEITKSGGEITKVTFKNSDGTEVPNMESVSSNGNQITAKLIDGSELAFSYENENLPNGSTTVNVNASGIGGMKIQVGTKTGQEIQVVVPSLDTDSLGIGKYLDQHGKYHDAVYMRTEEGARESLSFIQRAIERVSASRSELGAYQNRLESTIAALAETTENLEGSYSTIHDVDMAEEMVDYTKLQVLVQAGTSMLSQANEQPQQALQLLQ